MTATESEKSNLPAYAFAENAIQWEIPGKTEYAIKPEPKHDSGLNSLF